MDFQRDAEYNQMLLNAPGPSASQSAGRGTHIAEEQGRLPLGLSEQRVEVTVHRAINVPSIKKYSFLKRNLFVAVSNSETTVKTKDVLVEEQTAKWDQKLDAFLVQPPSHLTLCLYAKRYTHSDILIGTHEIPIPLASQSDIPCVLENGVGGAPRSTQPVTLYITVHIASPNPYNSPSSIPTGDDDFPAKEATATPECILPPAPECPLSLSHPQPIETGTTMPQSREEVSPTSTKNPRLALDQADEAMDRIVPTDESDSWEGAVGRIEWVMDTLGPIAELFPLAKMAHGLLVTFPKTILEQYQRDDNVQTLFRAMHDAFDFAHHEDTLKSIKPKSEQELILAVMLQDVGSCCDFIQSYAKDSQFWKRTLKNLGGGPDKKIKELSDGLVERRKAFLDQATISTEITAFQILDDVANISTQLQDLSTQLQGISIQLQDLSSQASIAELDAMIRDIPCGTIPPFSIDKGCLTGTRVAFLEFIINWVNNPGSERGLVLFGQAGMGKSSIAHEIARRFDKMHRLTSSIFFIRKQQSEPTAYHLFTTLARDLADRYPSFKIALGKAVKNNTTLRVRTHDYLPLFEDLILKPLKGLHIVGPILVVIDALDESGDTTNTTGLHTFIAKNLIRLPSNFRVVITSRPEQAIESALARAPVKIKYMNDTKLAAETDEDILAFLREELATDKLGGYVEMLAKKAEGLFQWAAVASQLVLYPPEDFDYDEETCIKHLLEPSANPRGEDPLDKLYEKVLGGYFKSREAKDHFCAVVGQLITSIEPLTIRSIITLQQHDSHTKRSDATVTGVLRRLGSLLSNVNSSDNSLPIIPLHTSFRDFLTNKDKSGDFYVGVPDALHHQLAHSCLNVLLDPVDGLKFNICKLETSYLANDDVQDLNTRIHEHIPPALLYACRFWDGHLKHTGFNMDLFRKVETLFKEKFLFWLEALSLTRSIGFAASAFATMSTWLVSSQRDSQSELEELRSFVNDAAIFVRHFGLAMAKSAPHIYLSALPFAPSCSLVSMHYSTLFSRILHVERGQLSHWPSSEMAISNCGAAVSSVAFSPNGQHIVSGSDDQSIRVWNAMTGEIAAGAFTGHTDSVNSVAFSPDGQHIVSGSKDRKIRVWNSTTGETVADPFTGHANPVKSVAFSPDGQYIVSGSEDRTIRVWNVMTGEAAAGPFTGHTDFVSSVAFSPDGQHIVSGSGDRTVRVWNVMTGEAAAGPFTGHTGRVLSVAFSPDGQHIASGSMDQTIRVWNAMTGETAASPFTGHIYFVSSVAFSPDGQHIVSGSGDGTVCVWDVMTGETAAGPITGHTSPVKSVAFSPDGQHVVSGSDDRTIRVWNVMTRGITAVPFTGYTNYVASVAFSPSGQHIVSGSGDRTICVWNAMTGETAAGPLTGHSAPICSVAFSPDGQYIASGSEDLTIRVWNAMTGETTGPFTGHTDSIGCVAFSPDGQHIVSGSGDRTIRVWNAMTGECAASPFTGHTDPVNSVVFSPDGQRIASGSDDRTIRVWNAMTGETASGPFTGHTDWVESVAFSPDGQHIVSGSDDRTIRVWNAITGETAAGPFTGHTARVFTVAFSPDGQYIVSGSEDRTIRVWNAMTGRTVAGPFTIHTGWVTSVVFSPDGQHIASGSSDRTIRVSKITIGKMETTNDVDFTDNDAIDDEGWICGSKGELLMWVPSVQREYLHRPSTIWVSGKRDVVLDLSSFVHGLNWSTCINTQQ